MKALLINPHVLIPKSLTVMHRASPPLGLAYIAGILENEKWEVSVYDCIAENPHHYFPFEGSEDFSVQGAEFDKIFEHLDTHYDLIGVSVMFTNNWLANRHLLNLLKQHYPDSLVVAGGEHVTAIPEFCLQDCLGLDIIVTGEGEETIAEIAATLREGQSYRDVKGIAYKDRSSHNQITVNPRRVRISEVNDIPPPAWKYFPLEKYFDNGIACGVSYGRSLPVFATRGCPFQCTFCSSPQMWGTKYIMRDVNNVIDEIKHLNVAYGVTNFDFYDLTAIIRREWILHFCQRIKEEGLRITWQIPAGTRSEAIDYEVAVALKESGCVNITYAPESGSERMLKIIKKKVKLKNMLKSIDDSYRAGLNIKLNIIMGYPDERISDMLRTTWFLIKASWLGAHDASPCIFSPYPGSELYSQLTETHKVRLSDDYFRTVIFSESLHGFINYNRYLPKWLLIFFQYLAYSSFYISNYLFRPARAIRFFRNMMTRHYRTRGEYMLATILMRKKEMKPA